MPGRSGLPPRPPPVPGGGERDHRRWWPGGGLSHLGAARRARSRFSRAAREDTVERNGGQLPGPVVRPADLATELRESDARYRAVVETAGDGIVSANSDGVITSFNAAAERMFGYTRVEAVGRSLTVLMPERFHAAHT